MEILDLGSVAVVVTSTHALVSSSLVEYEVTPSLKLGDITAPLNDNDVKDDMAAIDL